MNCFFSFERKGLAGILNCDGKITSEYVHILRDSIMTCIEHSEHIIINCSNLTSIDIPCIQIFCIAYRIALRSNKQFSVSGMRKDIHDTFNAEIGNFCSSGTPLGCSNNCLWSTVPPHTLMQLPAKEL